jgi:hypothetical protein
VVGTTIVCPCGRSPLDRSVKETHHLSFENRLLNDVRGIGWKWCQSKMTTCVTHHAECGMPGWNELESNSNSLIMQFSKQGRKNQFALRVIGGHDKKEIVIERVEITLVGETFQTIQNSVHWFS